MFQWEPMRPNKIRREQTGEDTSTTATLRRSTLRRLHGQELVRGESVDSIVNRLLDACAGRDLGADARSRKPLAEA